MILFKHNVFKPFIFKGWERYIFASLFCMSEREHFWNKKKKFFFSLQNFFLFLRQSDFNFSNIQMSWRHQMPKHKTRNIFYWITWEVNIVWWWNFASLCNITKWNFLSKNYGKYGLETSSRSFLFFKESSVKRNQRRSVCYVLILLIHV